jgi:CRISPR-associated protein Csb1
VALHDELKAAVRSLHIGDALPMASLAPTALLLGVWNERDTRATAQRVLAATTRALDWGRAGHPARSAPGEASQGDLRQATTLHLAALRSLRTRDVGSTALLQEYLLGLALVALTAPSSAFLRPGCILVPAEAEATTVTGVAHDGARHPLKLTHEQALAFAIARAKAFGVAGEREWMADEVAA